MPSIIQSLFRRKTGPKILFCHILDPGNLGDQVCCPIDYISKSDFCGFDYTEIDIREQPFRFKADAIIFGGGGIFHPGVDEQVEAIAYYAKQHNPNVNLICWGAGTNYHQDVIRLWPDYLKRFDLVGLRDAGNGNYFAACPSCMHPAFDDLEPVKPHHEFVVYAHKHHPLDIDAPHMTNGHPKGKLIDALRFLASGRSVVTNTYHGAYWGALLGRSVVIVNPFSTRFHYGFHIPIPTATNDNWREVLATESFPMPPGQYLAECRESNVGFLRLARKVVMKKGA